MKLKVLDGSDHGLVVLLRHQVLGGGTKNKQSKHSMSSRICAYDLNQAVSD
jgi:hypothetical protein